MHTLAASLSIADDGSEPSDENILEHNYSCTNADMRHFFEQGLLKSVYTH